MTDAVDDLSSRTYRLLRQHADWSDDQLATALGAVPDEIGKILEELATMGLVHQAPTDGGHRWVVVDPLVALEQTLQAHTRSVSAWSESARQMTEDVGDLLSRLPNLRTALVDDEINAILEGNDKARTFLAELGSSLRRELLAVHPGGGVAAEAIEAALPEDLAVLDRGVQMRTIYQTSAVRHPPTLAYLERLAEAGASVRIRDTLPYRMIIADGATAVCSMKWAEGRSGAVVVRGAALLNLLRRIFDFCWVESTPLENLGPAARTGGQPLDDEQRLLLRLLADGATDQAIARQLGVAPRTCTRKLRALFDVLGVGSRFQAGAEAVRRGLL